MCGFVGGTDPSWNYAAALASIVHRGPDDGRLHLEEPVRVGFRRLSIIDLDPSANQPMFADDGETWIVFNGEIYGFPALRRELQRLGHVFRTHSDTEVLVHLYEEYGKDFLSQLNGMFGFAIADFRRRRVLIARDRLGIKPMFLAHADGSWLWGSEIKTLLATGYALTPRFNLAAELQGIFEGDEQKFLAGPTASFSLNRKTWLAIGPAWGLNSDADDFRLRALFGIFF